MADSVAEHIAALDDEDWGIREDAAVALGQFNDPRSIQPLIRLLRDSDRAVREAAAASLTALGQPAVQSLGFCLQDPNLQVQQCGSRSVRGSERSAAGVAGDAVHDRNRETGP